MCEAKGMEGREADGDRVEEGGAVSNVHVCGHVHVHVCVCARARSKCHGVIARWILAVLGAEGMRIFFSGEYRAATRGGGCTGTTTT